MKAMVDTRYGPPEALKYTEVKKPAVGGDEVLVEVHASSLNFGDVALLKGSPFVACAFNATSLFLGPLISKREGKKIVSLIHKNNTADLIVKKELFETGKVVSIIDSCYPLSELPEAVRHFEAGDPRGKVVITMEKNDE